MSGIRNTRVRGVAVTALLAALSLVVLYLSAFSPAARMGVVAAAGLVPAGAVISVGLGAGFCCYGVTGLLGILNLTGVPYLEVGIPGILSLYFDVFSGGVQALVFSLLTMVYIGNACPPPEEV